MFRSIYLWKPAAISLFPAHIAWLRKHSHLNKFDLSSVKTVSIAGSSINPAYEREIFDKLPNLLFLNNVKKQMQFKCNSNDFFIDDLFIIKYLFINK
jgi:hypothetical protein